MEIKNKILKAVLLLRACGKQVSSKEKLLEDINRWMQKGYFTEAQLDEWILQLQEELAKPESVRKAESEKRADEEASYDVEERYTSCTAGDYGPSHPWDAPGMSISDFI
jgi:hypothetical protein